eukprot:scaffold28845_cov123-Isochrysis_galbana.AAC.2
MEQLRHFWGKTGRPAVAPVAGPSSTYGSSSDDAPASSRRSARSLPGPTPRGRRQSGDQGSRRRNMLSFARTLGVRAKTLPVSRAFGALPRPKWKAKHAEVVGHWMRAPPVAKPWLHGARSEEKFF